MGSTTRTFKVVGLAAAVMAVMVLSASSGEIDLWTDPEPGVSEPVIEVDTGDRTPPPEPEDDDGDRVPSDAGTVMDLLAGVVVVVLMATAVMVAAGPHQWQLPLGRLRRRARSALDWREPLPEVSDTILEVDVDAALEALSEGEPRNAIVACWMRLEHDAAAMGFARSEAETSSDYVARVVAAASVDPGPITELAALYREARFSSHQISGAHRTAAVLTLEAVVAALRTSSGVSA